MSNGNLTTIPTTMEKDPFRVFFPLGTALAILGVLPWTTQVFSASNYPAAFHKALMLNGFMLSFVSGFLMTAIPRFTSSAFATRGEIGVVFCTIFVGSAAAFIGSPVWSHLAAVAALLFLTLFGLRRFLKRQANPPFTFIFVGFGILLWTLSNGFLFLAAQDSAFAERIRIWQELHSTGAVMAMVLGVGGRLIPGILGWQAIVTTQQKRYEDGPSFMAAVPASIWALLCLYLFSFALLDTVDIRICLAMRTFVICYFAFRFWKIHHSPFERTYLTWCIWLSCWCFVAGALLTLLWPQYYTHFLHVSLIAGFSLLTILIATRVTLAHGNEGKGVEKTWRGLYILSALITIAAITRAMAILWPSQYLHLLGYAAFTWVFGFVIWAFAMIPKMFSGLRSSRK